MKILRLASLRLEMAPHSTSGHCSRNNQPYRTGGGEFFFFGIKVTFFMLLIKHHGGMEV